VRIFAGQVFAVKAHSLIDAEGSDIIHSLYIAGAENVWVDHKLHDGAKTVAARVRALVNKGARIITVHASGGIKMMQAALRAARYPGWPKGPLRAEIWAVTVLSTMSRAEVWESYHATPQDLSLRWALLAKRAGLMTIVCSAEEVGMLSRHPELAGMKFVVPGTRPEGAALGQQQRSGTPRQAAANGTTYFVVESVVTEATDPQAAFSAFKSEIQAGAAARPRCSYCGEPMTGGYCGGKGYRGTHEVRR
jgi:orotidine-5'-phosphate decarboxylase